MKNRISWAEAHSNATDILEAIRPHCHRCNIGGSIRRQRAQVGDIEIIAIPKPYEVGLFQSGIATVMQDWEVVRGHLPCKYTQRLVPGCPVPVDFFFADERNWGYISALRTGPAEWSKEMVIRLKERGYTGKDGHVYGRSAEVAVPDENTLFKLLGWAYEAPERRGIDAHRNL